MHRRRRGLVRVTSRRRRTTVRTATPIPGPSEAQLHNQPADTLASESLALASAGRGSVWFRPLVPRVLSRPAPFHSSSEILCN